MFCLVYAFLELHNEATCFYMVLYNIIVIVFSLDVGIVNCLMILKYLSPESFIVILSMDIMNTRKEPTQARKYFMI